jgi:hypothetical protein
VTGGLEGLVEEAERLAEAIRDEAQERARTTLATAEVEATARLEAAHEEAVAVMEERRQRYSELSDAIIAHSDLVLEHLKRAGEARGRLDQAVRALREESRPSPELSELDEAAEEAPAREEDIADASVPTPEGAGEGAAPQPTGDAAAADAKLADADADADADAQLSGARLLALHMAVAGDSRSDAERYLRRVYGIAEPEAIVDEIYARYETRE